MVLEATISQALAAAKYKIEIWQKINKIYFYWLWSGGAFMTVIKRICISAIKNSWNGRVVWILIITFVISLTDVATKSNENAGAYEEIRVESSLNVRKSNPAARRHVRSVVDILVPDNARVKRQFGWAC